jgi:flagellar biosynthesis protein FlhF
MKLKSFFANSIEEAIRLARQELGPEAMLVNSKRSGAEAQHLGLYEVVVCVEGPEPKPAEGRREGPSVASVPVDQLAHQVSELKQQMEKLALTLARSGRGKESVAFDPDLSRVFNRLTDAELDTELAYDIVGRLRRPVSETSLRGEIASLVKTNCELGKGGSPSRAIALVGPPGAGKTSALVKLAVQYGLTAGKSVQVFTTDTFRIAAAEELRSYAAILGIGCEVLETAAALAQALTESSKPEFRCKDLILIDTPGLCRSEMEASEELASLIASHPAVDTHLVLPASMRASDLRRISEQYGIFGPRKLLFTRLDETETFGPIVSRSVRMGIPVSFFSRGQRIPEDLEPATAEVLLDLLLGQVFGARAGEPSPPSAPSNDPAPRQAPHQEPAPKFGVAAAGDRAA